MNFKLCLAILLGLIGTAVAGYYIIIVLCCFIALYAGISILTTFLISSLLMSVGLLIIYFARRLFVLSLTGSQKPRISLPLFYGLLALAVPFLTLLDMFYEHAAFYWRYFHWSFLLDGGTSDFELLLQLHNFSQDAAKTAAIGVLTPFGITLSFLTLSGIFMLFPAPKPNPANDAIKSNGSNVA